MSADRSDRRKPRLYTLCGVGAYVAAYAWWQVSGWGGPGLKPLIGDLAFVPLLGTAAVTAWRASLRCAEVPRLRSAWRLIAVGVVFYLIGSVLQTYQEAFVGSIRYPAPAAVAAPALA